MTSRMTLDLGEAWFHDGSGFYWSNNWWQNPPTWTKITRNSGRFGVTLDGNRIFNHNLISNIIEYGTNRFSPSWVRLIGIGDMTSTGFTINQINDLRVIDNLLWLNVRLSDGNYYRGVYDYSSAGWTWYILINDTFPILLPAAESQGTWYGKYGNVGGVLSFATKNKIYNHLIADYVDSGFWFAGLYGGISNLWASTSAVYIVRSNVNHPPDWSDPIPGYDFIHRSDTGTEWGILTNPYNGNGDASGWTIRTSIDGAQFYGVDSVGRLFVSDDGVTVQQRTTVGGGTIIRDGLRAGGGVLIAGLFSATSPDPDLIRISTDGGITWQSNSGNLWTLFGTTATIARLQLILPGSIVDLGPHIYVNNTHFEPAPAGIGISDSPFEIPAGSLAVNNIKMGQ